jgi:CheY-like chemotaxis protein
LALLTAEGFFFDTPPALRRRFRFRRVSSQRLLRPESRAFCLNGRRSGQKNDASYLSEIAELSYKSRRIKRLHATPERLGPPRIANGIPLAFNAHNGVLIRHGRQRVPPAESRRLGSDAMRLQLPSLLITDDDHDFRETLRAVFEPRFRTLTAGDGEEALDIVRREEVHLMLLDMHMPRLTGLETLRRVKQFRSRLPCILLSARVDEMLVKQAELADAFSVLSKPISRQQITSTVESAMRRIYNWGDSTSGIDKPEFPRH